MGNTLESIFSSEESDGKFRLIFTELILNIQFTSSCLIDYLELTQSGTSGTGLDKLLMLSNSIVNIIQYLPVYKQALCIE